MVVDSYLSFFLRLSCATQRSKVLIDIVEDGTRKARTKHSVWEEQSWCVKTESVSTIKRPKQGKIINYIHRSVKSASVDRKKNKLATICVLPAKSTNIVDVRTFYCFFICGCNAIKFYCVDFLCFIVANFNGSAESVKHNRIMTISFKKKKEIKCILRSIYRLIGRFLWNLPMIRSRVNWIIY